MFQMRMFIEKCHTLYESQTLVAFSLLPLCPLPFSIFFLTKCTISLLKKRWHTASVMRSISKDDFAMFPCLLSHGNLQSVFFQLTALVHLQLHTSGEVKKHSESHHPQNVCFLLLAWPSSKRQSGPSPMNRHCR